MKILHTEQAVGWGGQEMRVYSEAKKAAQLGHEVIILCQPGTGLSEKLIESRVPNLSYRFVKMRGTLDLLAFLKIYFIIVGEGIDIVHTHSSMDSWIASCAAKLAGKKVVRGRHLSIPIKPWFPKYIVYTSLPDRIITSGTVIADVLKKIRRLDPRIIISIPTGVDFSFFDSKLDGGGIRDELNIGADTPLIGKIAVLRNWKGHLYFIDAVSRVLSEFPNAFFVIVGDGPQYDNIKKYIEDKNLSHKIKLLGHRTDIPEIMAALDIVVQASYENEGIPQVVSQAFAMKKCVVGTSCGGIPEVVKDGDTGILVPPKNSNSIGEAIIKFLKCSSAEKERISTNAYSLALNSLSDNVMIQKILSVYYELLQKR